MNKEPVTDMFGNTLNIGDYFAYAELQNKTRAVVNIYQVIATSPDRFNARIVRMSGYESMKGSKFVQCASEKAILLKDFKGNV